MNYDKDMAGFKVKFQTEVILTFYEEFAVIFDDARLRSCNKCIMVYYNGGNMLFSLISRFRECGQPSHSLFRI